MKNVCHGRWLRYTLCETDTRMMHMLRRLMLSIALTMTLALAPTAMAGAQDANYPGGDGQVLSDQQDRGDGQVLGVVTSRPDSGVLANRAAAAPSSLAVTGSDVVQLSLIGVALLAGGTVLVRRSRRQSPATASA